MTCMIAILLLSLFTWTGAVQPRLAICMSGSIRNYVAIAWTFEQRVLEPTVNGNASISIFFHVWSHGDDLSVEGERRMRALPGFVKGEVENYKDWESLTHAFYTDGTNNPPYRYPSIRKNQLFFRSQWRKVWLTFKLASESSISYDAYVRVRPDYFWMVPQDWGALHKRLASRPSTKKAGGEYFAFPECHGTNPLGDQWLMASPKAMELYAAPVTASEPDCCERFLSHRFQRLNVKVIDASPKKCPDRSSLPMDSKPSSSAWPLYMTEGNGFLANDLTLHPKLIADGTYCLERNHAEYRYKNVLERAPVKEVAGYCIPRKEVPPWAIRGSNPAKPLPNKGHAWPNDPLPCLKFTDGGPPEDLRQNKTLLLMFEKYLARDPEERWPRYSAVAGKICSKRARRKTGHEL